MADFIVAIYYKPGNPSIRSHRCVQQREVVPLQSSRLSAAVDKQCYQLFSVLFERAEVAEYDISADLWEMY